MMIFPWRRRSDGGRKTGFVKEMELTVPPHFICPVTLDLMKDPVTLSTGVTYDRESIEKWIESGNITCPVTNQIFMNLHPIPNHSIRKMIQNWCVDNKCHGVERIPTPRVPITPHEISEMKSKMAAATRTGDSRKLLDLVLKVRNLAMESERNKRCIIGNGIGSVIADSFQSFASVSGEVKFDLLKELLSSLTWSFPSDSEGISHLKSAVSINFITGFLKDDDLTVKQNAISVLKLLVSVDDQIQLKLEGIEETLVNILKLPISTKRTLAIIHHILQSCSENTASTFIESGLIPLLVEIILDGDKIICEVGSSILDQILSFERGREAVCENALAVPLLIKKISRVSKAATEICVSCIWKMRHLGDVVEEAVKLGGFQKLLLVLQIGCGDETREKASELLKIMNLMKTKAKIDCFQSSLGFQFVKTS